MCVKPIYYTIERLKSYNITNISRQTKNTLKQSKNKNHNNKYSITLIISNFNRLFKHYIRLLLDCSSYLLTWFIYTPHSATTINVKKVAL